MPKENPSSERERKKKQQKEDDFVPAEWADPEDDERIPLDTKDKDEDEVDDPWAGFVPDFSPGPGGGPPQADSVAPRGTPEWRRAVEARREWEGDQLHRQAALTGGELDNPDELEQMLRDIGIWETKPNQPGTTSHKWNFWTGNLPSEGFGMTDVGPYQVPFATQRYQPEWKWQRDYDVQQGHLIPGSEAGTYYNPRGNGTADTVDQFGNVTGNVPWPITPVPDASSATDPGTVPVEPSQGSGFGTPPDPGSVQSLTNSMAGFSPLTPTPTPGAPTQQPSKLEQSGPTVSDTIKIERKTAPPRRVPMSRSFPGTRTAPSQGAMPRKVQGWYGDFGV